MKKYLTLLAIALLILPIVSASQPVMYRQPLSSQYYTVGFDGEGEAAVAAKITVQNTGTTELRTLVLEIPGQNIRMINLVQEYYNYNQRYVYSYKPIEYNQNTLSNSVTYTFNLPEKVGPQESVSVLLYYKTSSYAKKGFDAFDFDFETIKLNYDTQQVRVAVQVNPNLYLDGGKAEVAYRSSFVGFASEMSAASESVQSDSLSRFSNSIGYGGYYKTANDLDPLESFHVTGRYAKSWFALHWFGLMMGILMSGLAIAFVTVFSIKRMRKMKSKSNALNIVGTAFAANLVMGVIWGAVILLIHFVLSYMRSGEPLALIVILFASLLTLALLFGPSLMMGVRHGVGAGIWTLVATFTFAFILSTIVFIVFAAVTGTL